MMSANGRIATEHEVHEQSLCLIMHMFADKTGKVMIVIAIDSHKNDMKMCSM